MKSDETSHTSQSLCVGFKGYRGSKDQIRDVAGRCVQVQGKHPVYPVVHIQKCGKVRDAK